MKEIKIDFNEDTFKSLVERLELSNHRIDSCIVVMTNKQFQTFKMMYKFEKIDFDEHGFFKREIIQPTPMGSVYGLEYKVED